MADPSALSCSSSLPRSLASRRPLSSPLHGVRPRTPRRCRLGSRLPAQARKGGDPKDIYGPYPWEQPLDLITGFDIEWVQEDKVTLFTSDGLVQIGGSMVPRRVAASEKRQQKAKGAHKPCRFQESSYMHGSKSKPLPRSTIQHSSDKRPRHGEKIVHLWILPVHRDAQRCSGRYGTGAWRRGEADDVGGGPAVVGASLRHRRPSTWQC